MSVLTYQAPCRFFLRQRAPAGEARIDDGRQFVRHPVELVVRLERRQQGLVMGSEFSLRQDKAEFGCNLAQLLECRDLDGVERHSLLSTPTDTASHER